MYSYKIARTDDLKEIEEYCKENNVSCDGCSNLFVARNEEGKVVGVAGVKRVYQIEPLVSESARITQILGEKAMALISTVAPEAIALVKSDKVDYIKVLSEYGFTITDDSMIVLKKEV